MNIPIEQNNFVPPQAIAAIARDIVEGRVKSSAISPSQTKNYTEALADQSLITLHQDLERATATYESVSSALNAKAKAAGIAIPRNDIATIVSLQKKADDLSNGFAEKVRLRAQQFKVDPDELGSMIHEISDKVTEMEKGSRPVTPTRVPLEKDKPAPREK